MRHPVIADGGQVDLVEPVFLITSGKVDQAKRTVNDLGPIARLLPEDGSGVGLDRSFRIFDAQSAAVAPIQLNAPFSGISREAAGLTKAASLNHPVKPEAASSPKCNEIAWLLPSRLKCRIYRRVGVT